MPTFCCSPALLAIAIGLTLPTATAAAPFPGAPFLRTTQSWIASVLAEAPLQSPTLHALIEQLRSAKVIVYLDRLDHDEVGWDGRIRYIGTTPVVRYLRIELRQLAPVRTAAVLAHELQHAVEVAAADVRSPAQFDALFRRIGFVVPGTAGHVDTAAAVRAGETTLRELSGVPPSTSLGRHGRRR